MLRLIANCWSRFFGEADNDSRSWDPYFIDLFREDLRRKLRHPGTSVKGQCLNVSLYFLEEVERIFKERYPQYQASHALICIGNARIGLNSPFLVNDVQAREFAENPAAEPTVVREYHAWVSIEGIIVDLTLLYSMEGVYDDLNENEIIVSTSDLSSDYGRPIEFFSYNTFTKQQLFQLAGL